LAGEQNQKQPKDFDLVGIVCVAWIWACSRSDTLFPARCDDQVLRAPGGNSPDDIVDFVVVDLYAGRQGEAAAEKEVDQTVEQSFAQGREALFLVLLFQNR
jgi:hypothetical protein